jgi:hypothetical protein
MSDVFLGLCYESLFSGLPLMRLRTWRSFEWAHDRRVSPIVGLAEFNAYFDDVLRMFRENNFAQEYVTSYPTERTTRFAGLSPPRAQDSPAQCESSLRALRSTIMHLGPAAVHTEIDRLCVLHERDPRYFVRRFILQNHDPAALSAPTYGGAHFRTSHLLRRIQDL